MKTLGRILIILAVFSIFSGLMVVAVNASGASVPAVDGASSQLRPGGGVDQFRPERGDRGGAGGSRWMFGVVKNVGVMAVLVTLIVLPRSVAKKKKKQAAVNAMNDQP